MLGSRDHASVAKVQKQLNARGASPALPIDGNFDEATRDAVLAFQRRHFADEPDWDGKVGPRTWQALFETPTRSVEPEVAGGGEAVSGSASVASANGPATTTKAHGASTKASAASGVLHRFEVAHLALGQRPAGRRTRAR